MRFVLDMRDRLVAALAAVYREKFRLEWQSGQEPPHFFDQQQAWFNLGFTADHHGPYVLWRGFLAAELVADGDLVLDLGSGDGFYTARFLAPRAREAHGVDCDNAALDMARACNPAPNVRYFLADAATDPFPAPAYDVVVWNGSIGHFAPDAARDVLEKVRSGLAPGGVFVGSEALGEEDGADHLLTFRNADEVADMLGGWFRLVDVREQSYRIGGGSLRREVYWRCAQSPERLDRASFARRSYPVSARG